MVICDRSQGKKFTRMSRSQRCGAKKDRAASGASAAVNLAYESDGESGLLASPTKREIGGDVAACENERTCVFHDNRRNSEGQCCIVRSSLKNKNIFSFIF